MCSSDLIRNDGSVKLFLHPARGLRRTQLFIDPDGIVRATTCYPVTVGRSVREMLRTLAALQESDAAGALAPEGWQPGDPLLCQPEATLDDAFSTSDALSWFLKEKPNG